MLTAAECVQIRLVALRAIINGLADRVATQSELLTRRAERPA